MNVLIIDDEVPVAKFIQKILNDVMPIHIIDMAHSFEEGYEKASSGIFDIILVDIDLQSGDLTGIDLCQAIRKSDPQIPLVMVTGFHDIAHLEKAFSTGVSDYITKPFKPKELQLRVKRWFQMSQKIEARQKISYKELSYDSDSNEVFFHDEKLLLTRKQKVLLLLFLEHPEQVLSAPYITEKFWGDYTHCGKSRNLRSNIQILREALQGYCDSWIQTVRGEGYMLQKT